MVAVSEILWLKRKNVRKNVKKNVIGLALEKRLMGNLVGLFLLKNILINTMYQKKIQRIIYGASY